jgi:hypothetical protein
MNQPVRRIISTLPWRLLMIAAKSGVSRVGDPYMTKRRSWDYADRLKMGPI